MPSSLDTQYYCVPHEPDPNVIPDPDAGEIFERLRSRLIPRFVTICCNLTPEDFRILIDDMAREQIRGENAKRWR